MKIAVPTDGDKGLNELIGQHFGRVKYYTLVDTETNEVRVIPNTSHHMGGVGYPPEILADAGVDILLCSGLGKRAVQMFREKKIKVYVGAYGTVGDAIESYTTGDLIEASEDSACSQHAFRSHLHGTGSCGKKE